MKLTLQNLAVLTLEDAHSVSYYGRMTGMAYCHINNIITLFEGLKLVKTAKKGRDKIVTRTAKGNKLGEALLPVLQQVDKLQS